MHDYHEAAANYSPNQVLHDECGECEARSKSADGGLAHLDRQNFFMAWHRATEWNRNGLPDLARAEMPLLCILWSVQLKLEQCCHLPVGELPNHA
jgi:hypothetical protein